jgi:hypothetical protein
MSRVNQVTPYGNLTYSQDPNNQDLWTATQTMSPAEAANYGLSTQAQGLYGRTALNQLGAAAGALSQPINTDYSAVRDQYIKSQMGLIQPQLDTQRQALESKLANQGVVQGSPAYANAMRDFSNTQSSMYNTILGGAGNTVGQAIQQQIALRDQPLNEASALLSGSQVQAPSFTNVPQAQVQPTNVLGAYQQAQDANLAAYNAKVANQSAQMGGMASIVGQGLGAWGMAGFPMPSDERLKTDIREVGTLKHPGGDIPIKAFRFKGSPTRQLGLIAQDVEPVDAGAVQTDPLTGYKGLNYSRVLMGLHGGGRGQRT